jgi:uncharacterized membrane protein
MPVSSRAPRIESVDVLRGVIMIVMALDHTRDYFGDLAASPTNLATTTAALFATRWVTNICAPVFFLLTGTGAYLSLRRRSVPELSRFLVTRGLWMILLELTFARFLWQFNVDYHVTILTVLWAFGWSMLVLAALVHLPARVAAGFGLAMIALHNLLDPIRTGVIGVLHAPSMLLNIPGHVVFAAYPVIPWIGVTAAGFGLGSLFDQPAESRRRLLRQIGWSSIAAFILLRGINVYGDPSRWSVQATPLFTVLSFLNTTKYPPSLLFLLMTLGPAMLILAAVDGETPSALRPALIIGKVPFFYYLVHVLVLHTLAVIASAMRFGTIAPTFESPTLDKYPITQVPGWPAPLPVVYAVWIAVVLILYPLCRWYAALRQRSTAWWLSYL